MSSRHLPAVDPADTWRSRALCGINNLPADVSPELWFTDLGKTADVEKAKAICALCQVRTPCREEALADEGDAPGDAKERPGIRAGLTGGERYELYRLRRGRARTP